MSFGVDEGALVADKRVAVYVAEPTHKRRIGDVCERRLVGRSLPDSHWRARYVAVLAKRGSTQGCTSAISLVCESCSARAAARVPISKEGHCPVVLDPH